MSKKSIGAIVDEIYNVRAMRLDLEKEVSLLKSRQAELEQEFLNIAQEQSITSARGQIASSSISELTLPNVTDWDALQQFISETGYFHLLERRPSAGAYKEAVERGIEIPGVEPFTKYKINTQRVTK